MEPRLESRGIASSSPTPPPADRASMEPRLESRGIVATGRGRIRNEVLQWSRGSKAAESPDHDADWRCGLAASMEPRLESRGISVDRAERRRGVGSFNGAAARKPRNRDGTMTATISPKASMEPRLESRGICSDPPLRSESLIGFNGAAARKPRNLAAGDRVWVVEGELQWSRGSKAAESRIGWYQHTGLITASMEPRLESRGIRGSFLRFPRAR